MSSALAPLGELCTEGLEVVEPIISAAEQGTIRLVTGFEAGLYASKGCLALLRDDDHRSVLSPAERALVDRTVPWTKTLRPGEPFVGNQRVDIADGRFVVQRRVRPATERFPTGDPVVGNDELALNWGVILAGTRYAGTIARALPGPDPGVINIALGAGATCTFHASE